MTQTKQVLLRKDLVERVMEYNALKFKGNVYGKITETVSAAVEEYLDRNDHHGK